MSDVRVSLDAGNLAFHTGVEGARAVYTTLGGELARVLGPGDALAGRTVDDADLGIEALSGDDIVLRVAFTNGDSGIYLATLVEPPAIPTFGNPGLLALGFALLLSGVLQRRG